jgi:hypothetical protein
MSDENQGNVRQRPILVAMRVVNLRVTHPRADYSHTCDRCREPICLFPSGQRILRENPGIQKLCDVCVAPEVAIIGIVPPEVEQEWHEAVPVKKA